MYNKVSEFEKSFPSIKNLEPEQKEKALDIFNALKKDGMEDGRAIAIAITRVKGTKDMEEKDKMDKEHKGMKKEMGMDENIFRHIDIIELKELNEKISVIEILKVGKVHDRNLEITEKMLDDFVKNFNDGVYGTDIQVNLAHQREGEAAGWVKDLIKEKGKLFAVVEWTPLGIEKIENKQFKFTSSELAFSHVHPETGKKIKNVLIGIALTNIPAIKGMTPVSLSEQANFYINNSNNMNKLKKMFTALSAKDAISAEEFKTFQKLAEDTATDENKEEVKEMEDELEPKVEEEKKIEEEEEEEKEEEEKKELAEKGKKFVTLTEYEKLEEEHAVLKEKVEFKELMEEVSNTMELSETVPVGFLGTDIEEVAKFMVGLTPEQRDNFSEIISKVHTVDLSVRGKTHQRVVNLNQGDKSYDEKVAERADQLLSEKKAKDIVEAQKMAASEISQ